MTISLIEETTPTETVLRVGGTVDLSTAEALTERLRGLVGSAGATVLVDLADVVFLDSTGLSALVSSQLAATQSGATLVVTRPTPNVRSLLRLTGLDQVLDVRETPEH